jgi:tetratricopeptide (TPR) repeat protein
VLASHHLEAIAADPEADDVAELRASARQALAAAGRAAASLALGPEALRYFEQAAELADNDDERAGLFEQAGRALQQSGDSESAEQRLRTAIELYEQSGRPGGGPAALALGMLLRLRGHAEAARPVLERFLAADDVALDRVARAAALAELASANVALGSLDVAGPLLDEALLILEAEQAWPQLALALVYRGVWLTWRSQREESIALLRHALRLAEQHDVPQVALRARFNLAAAAINGNRLAEAVEEINAGLLVARERGDRANERELLSQGVAPMTALGDWDQAASAAATVLAGAHDVVSAAAASYLAQIAAARGDDATLERCVALGNELRESADVDSRSFAILTRGRAALERGAADDALRLARAALESESNTGELVWEAYAIGVEAALERGDEAAMTWLAAFADALPPVAATPLIRAGRARLAAEQAHRRGEPDEADRQDQRAIELLRSLNARPLLARALLEHARRREDREALAEARAIYSELGATRWLAGIEDPAGIAA